jgi:hypothetical protein
MKKLNKLFSGLILAVGLLGMTRTAMAGTSVKSPKEVFVSTYTAGLVLVTPAISTNTTANAQQEPGAIYQIIMSTGASGEYFELYDSSTTTGITCGLTTGNGANQLNLVKLPFGSTSLAQSVSLDAPIVFHNGLVVCDSATTGQIMFTYELGRGLSGQ